MESAPDFRLCAFVYIETELASLRISLLPEIQSTLCPPLLISQTELTLSSIYSSQHFKAPTLVWLPWCQCCNVITVVNGKCGGYSQAAPCSRKVCSWICLWGIGCAWNFLNRSIICVISCQILEARSMHETNFALYPALESLPCSYIKSIYCCYFCFLIWIHSILSQKDLLIKHDHFLSEHLSSVNLLFKALEKNHRKKGHTHLNVERGVNKPSDEIPQKYLYSLSKLIGSAFLQPS